MAGVVHHVERLVCARQIPEDGAAEGPTAAGVRGERVGIPKYSQHPFISGYTPKPLTVGRVLGRLVPEHWRVSSQRDEHIVWKASREGFEVSEIDVAHSGPLSPPGRHQS